MSKQSIVYIFFHPEIIVDSLIQLAKHQINNFEGCRLVDKVYLVGLIDQPLHIESIHINISLSQLIIQQLLNGIPDQVTFMHDDYKDYLYKNKRHTKIFDTRPYKTYYNTYIPKINWKTWNFNIDPNIHLLTCDDPFWRKEFSGIGCKRAISQMFHVQNYSNHHYIGIDNTTCPLYGPPYNAPSLKYATYGKVLSDPEVYNEIYPNCVVGFVKGSEPVPTAPRVSDKNTIYKFIIIGSNVIRNIWYDPFLYKFKEDVDWLSRASQAGYQFKKIERYWLCKDRNICENGSCSRNNNCPPSLKLISNLNSNLIGYISPDENYFIYLIRNLQNNYNGDKFYVIDDGSRGQTTREITYLIDQYSPSQPSNGFSGHDLVDGGNPTINRISGVQPYFDERQDKTDKQKNKPTGKCAFTNYDDDTFKLLKKFSETVFGKVCIIQSRGQPDKPCNQVSQFGGHKSLIVHKGVCFDKKKSDNYPVGIMHNSNFYKLTKQFIKSTLSLMK